MVDRNGCRKGGIGQLRHIYNRRATSLSFDLEGKIKFANGHVDNLLDLSASENLYCGIPSQGHKTDCAISGSIPKESHLSTSISCSQTLYMPFH